MWTWKEKISLSLWNLRGRGSGLLFKTTIIIIEICLHSLLLLTWMQIWNSMNWKIPRRKNLLPNSQNEKFHKIITKNNNFNKNFRKIHSIKRKKNIFTNFPHHICSSLIELRNFSRKTPQNSPGFMKNVFVSAKTRQKSTIPVENPRKFQNLLNFHCPKKCWKEKYNGARRTEIKNRRKTKEFGAKDVP